MFSISKNIILIIWLILLFVFIYIYIKDIRNVESLIYWWILFGLIFITWQNHITGKILLGVAFFLFIVSAVFVTLTLNSIAEVIMRLSFTFWLLGFGKAILEFKRDKKVNKSSD